MGSMYHMGCVSRVSKAPALIFIACVIRSRWFFSQQSWTHLCCCCLRYSMKKQRKLGQRIIAPGCHKWLGLAVSSGCHSLTRIFATFQVSCPSYSFCVTHELVGSYLLAPCSQVCFFFTHSSHWLLASPVSRTVLFIYLMLFSWLWYLGTKQLE